jgi:predicted 3-demethylubiquinone-9 3-methyltransferase (glyoxalase superfamily)
MKTTKLILFISICMTCGFASVNAKSNGNKNEQKMKAQLSTFLTFQENNAEEAMNFYVDLFEEAEILDIQRWGSDEGPAKEGTIKHAGFMLNGKEFRCSDSPIKHNWTFTPAVSIFIDCKTEDELERLYEKLSEGGEIAMPLANYGFSQKFAWVVDRFGVSWQLNLE